MIADLCLSLHRFFFVAASTVLWHYSQSDKEQLYGLLRFPVQHFTAAVSSMLRPFHVPIFLSVHIPLGVPLSLCISNACNIVRTFIVKILTYPHTLPYSGYGISAATPFRLVHSGFRQSTLTF